MASGGPDAARSWVRAVHQKGADLLAALLDRLAERKYGGHVIICSGVDSETLAAVEKQARTSCLRMKPSLEKPVDKRALAAALEAGTVAGGVDVRLARAEAIVGDDAQARRFQTGVDGEFELAFAAADLDVAADLVGGGAINDGAGEIMFFFQVLTGVLGNQEMFILEKFFKMWHCREILSWFDSLNQALRHTANFIVED